MANLIGIEIDNDEIRMAQVQGKSIHTISEHIPENLISNGKIILHDSLARHLKEIKKKGDFIGRNAAFILPEDFTFFKTITMPPVSDRQLKLNLPYEFRDFIGDDGSTYNYDYAVDYVEEDESGNPVSLHLYAAAGEKTSIAAYAETFRKAGFTLKLAIPREMAMIKLVSSIPAASNSEICIIDISYDHTRINIVHNGKLEASKTTDIGCRQIDGAISAAKEIDPYLASTYRETNYENVQQSPQCQAVYEQIGLEVLKAINFYRYENSDTDLQFITFSGSGARIPTLTESIARTVNLELCGAEDWFPDAKVNDETSQCLLTLGVTM